MALSNFGLGFTIRAYDRASATFQRVGGSFNRLASRIGRGSVVMRTALAGFTVGIGALAAGIGGLAATFGLAREAATFGQGLARVEAVSRATGEQMAQLRERAIEAGIATQFSPTQAVEGLAELSIRGFTAQESMNALTGALDLAAGGQISVGQASQTVGAALRAFRRDATQAGITTDQLLRITTTTSLQANELAIAVGNVSRGAGLARQSLEEMLPAIGLVRNTGVDASVAASSVSSAMIYMSQRAQRFRQIGVQLTHTQGAQAGQFRNFLDIILESAAALRRDYPDAARRSAAATRMFGRFGLTAFQAISSQIETGIRTAEGQVVRGAQAIEYLRNQMHNASGAAREMREIMLRDLGGQMVLLKGTVQTLAITLGEPFARVFRPIVRGITQILNAFIRFVNALPEGGRTILAGVIVGVSALTALFGAVSLVVVGLVLMASTIGTVVTVMGYIAIAAAPLLLIFGALAGGVALFVAAAREDVGGLGSTLTRWFEKIRLAFRAVVALITRGEFSEGLHRELKGPNEGIRRFALRLNDAFQRVRSFIDGLVKGFKAGLRATAPAVKRMISAFESLGRTFGRLFNSGTRAVRAITNEEAGSKGEQIGTRIGNAFSRIADALAWVARNVESFITKIGELRTAVAPHLLVLSNAFNDFKRALQPALRSLTRALGITQQNDESAASFGETIGKVVVVGLVVAVHAIIHIIRVLTVLVRTFILVMDIITLFKEHIRLMALYVHMVFTNVKNTILNAVDAMIAAMGRAATAIPAEVRPAAIQSLVRAGTAAQVRISGRRAAQTAASNMILQQTVTTRTAEARVVRGVGGVGQAMMDATIFSRLDELSAAIRQLSDRPVEVNVTVDGETIARATTLAGIGAAELGYLQGASFGAGLGV